LQYILFVLLTISTTREPATDLGFLLHKHPDRWQSFATSTGTAHVFYPQASAERCTAALLLEVDPIALVRGNKHNELTQYVNDRPYAASSMLAVALKEAFRTALTGRCDAKPELAAAAIPLEIRVPALRCRGGAGLAGANPLGSAAGDLARAVFEPLGWSVEAVPVPLDPPEWGDSPYLDLRLSGTLRLADALNHLYVLLPALDDAKHYWVSTEEVDKLVRAGGEWLARHPQRALITRRYLAHRRALTQSALARLAEADEVAAEELDNAVDEDAEAEGPGQCDTEAEGPGQCDAEAEGPGQCDTEKPAPLAVQRREAVLEVLHEAGARTVADLGCGDGQLTSALISAKGIDLVVATDVSVRALQLTARRVGLDRMPDGKKERLRIFQSALTYRDDRLAGLDAAVLMEVIEHIDAPRLAALERAVFGFAAPGTVVVTTPNAEYNVHFEFLPPGTMRHRDHRFEWTRAQFQDWARRVAADYGYRADFRGVGPEQPGTGSPTQVAVFNKETVATIEATAAKFTGEAG
jgi:SAM-dependent methyltransferase